MPYITQDRRKKLDVYIDKLDVQLYDLGDVGGDMNYVLFRLGLEKYKRSPKYATIEQFVGTLTCARDEFQRRITAIHEDKAIDKNGDIL